MSDSEKDNEQIDDNEGHYIKYPGASDEADEFHPEDETIIIDLDTESEPEIHLGRHLFKYKEWRKMTDEQKRPHICADLDREKARQLQLQIDDWLKSEERFRQVIEEEEDQQRWTRYLFLEQQVEFPTRQTGTDITKVKIRRPEELEFFRPGIGDPRLGPPEVWISTRPCTGKPRRHSPPRTQSFAHEEDPLEWRRKQQRPNWEGLGNKGRWYKERHPHPKPRGRPPGTRFQLFKDERLRRKPLSQAPAAIRQRESRKRKEIREKEAQREKWKQEQKLFDEHIGPHYSKDFHDTYEIFVKLLPNTTFASFIGWIEHDLGKPAEKISRPEIEEWLWSLDEQIRRRPEDVKPDDAEEEARDEYEDYILKLENAPDTSEEEESEEEDYATTKRRKRYILGERSD